MIWLVIWTAAVWWLSQTKKWKEITKQSWWFLKDKTVKFIDFIKWWLEGLKDSISDKTKQSSDDNNESTTKQEEK